MKTLSITIAFVAVLVGVSCSDSETGYDTTAQQNAQNDAQRLLLVQTIPSIQGTQTIFYREDLIRVHVARVPKADYPLILSSGVPIAKVFYTLPSPPNQFRLVLDNIFDHELTQYSMLHIIEFNTGYVPYQFHSATEIETAQTSGKITITNTEMLYTCVFL
ncbi:hypothetical protein [Flavobacterium terrisoli]|uniref:hypothetical protein n=1 Tax=Flavobacterium terrisoli TaxID=3242195 RepID=UPI0025429F31|nr:hypothetical protein [Flavobacterium buctense]